jgi:ergothioneine biosynthesis protein EgtB
VLDLARRYLAVREQTLTLAAPLSPEDQVVQAMPDTSPTKWHLAHTTWFFETFVLADPPHDPSFGFLFNSYYEAEGPRVERARRGLLTRPGLDQILAYRRVVDRRVLAALETGTLDPHARGCFELGLHHEQQHQELLLTDAKYLLGTQPAREPYRDDLARSPGRASASPLRWRDHAGGLLEIGADGAGFAFDNERPRHRAYVAPFALASRPIANAEVLGFIDAGGYRDHRLWLSDGWAAVQSQGWIAPLYWCDGALYDLAGVRAIDPEETACHLSYYEADAIARWLGARLPTEAEWELVARDVVARDAGADGNLLDAGRLHPAAATDDGIAQLFGDVWEWTQSSYSPYPGFAPLPGAVGEYNGKFMSGQYVLRGGSCLTPRDHIRPTYRNFFPPSARWQMTGARLARDV